jgi:predicted ATP-grasp superfamily ATP-dependent carboligase
MTATVLILDGNQRSALAATRSLGKRGLRVLVADENSYTMAGSSRYCSGTFVYPSPPSSPDRFTETVSRECASRGIDLVFPMTDLTSHHLLKKAGEIPNVRIAGPDFKSFESVTNKARLFDLADELNLPVPRTRLINSRQEVADALDSFRFPLVLKPYRSRIFSNGRWIVAIVRYARNAAELEHILDRVESFNGHPFLLQEYIEGQRQAVVALYNNGRPITLLAQHELRSKPRSGGVGVLLETIPLSPRLLEISHAIFDRVKWHGVGMVEFITARDGQPYLMEVNGRFWASLQLAIDAGVDFPWLTYKLFSEGCAEPVSKYRVGQRCRWLLGDFAQCVSALRGRGFGPHDTFLTALKSSAALLNFFHTQTSYDTLQMNDPAPFFREVSRYVNVV